MCVGWPTRAVADVGRIAESGRFARRYGRDAARTSAMKKLDPPKDCETVASTKPDFDELVTDWDVVLRYPEVPASLMLQEWRALRSRRWRWDDKVHIGEARSLRVGDNLRVVLALENKAADFRLLASVRRSCALELGWNLLVSDRWVPSELNPADSPSREWGEWPERSASASWSGELPPQVTVGRLLGNLLPAEDVESGNPGGASAQDGVLSCEGLVGAQHGAPLGHGYAPFRGQPPDPHHRRAHANRLPDGRRVDRSSSRRCS